MNKKYVGIIGATGQVGVGAVKTLLNNYSASLLLGGRKIAKLIEQFGEESETMKYQAVDVFNEASIQAFCENCYLVINTAGPSSLILARVAEACLVTNTTYIDVSGDKTMKLAIEDALAKHNNPITCSISAGVYPGLTEMFVAFLLRNQKWVERISCYFAGKGSFSETGAYDIISSLEKDEGYGMSYFSNGDIKKLTSGIGSQKVLPAPFHQVYTLPLMNEEFIACVKEYRAVNAYFYNTFATSKILSDFIMIKAMQLYKTEEEKRASAHRLIETYHTQDEHEGFIIYVETEENGKTQTSYLQSNMNWNYGSGVVAACVAMQMQERNGTNKKGCYFAQSIVDVEELMQQLIKTECISIIGEK